MAKATNWQALRERLPQRYTKAIAEKIAAFITANADEASRLGYEALTSRQVELVFKGEIKNSLKAACVLRFAKVLATEHAPVRKMLRSRNKQKSLKASKA